MSNKPTKQELLTTIASRLERHPGDAPWSCVECYHSRPCKDKEILVAAKKWIEQQP